jgi:hypothetical protein
VIDSRLQQLPRRVKTPQYAGAQASAFLLYSNVRTILALAHYTFIQEQPMPQSRPLEGLRVIELGQLLAGPFAGTILGYFGAEVIKVEPPTGDPIRQWREVRNGMSLWYHSLARNKKSVTLGSEISARSGTGI